MLLCGVRKVRQEEERSDGRRRALRPNTITSRTFAIRTAQDRNKVHTLEPLHGRAPNKAHET